MHLYEEQSLENAPVDESGMPISPVIRLHPQDDVVIARRQLIGGERIPEENLVVAGLIPPAHKVATRRIASGQPVRRYNQVIGVATQDIEAGQHVHTHNNGLRAKGIGPFADNVRLFDCCGIYRNLFRPGQQHGAHVGHGRNAAAH